ncbi:MAG: NUDIX domain-containing protein [Candidatus Vogelbacteria bacterium]|nr:NUDIX domain-containing protein [Candidatus Vogelbacteria bacterium]
MSKKSAGILLYRNVSQDLEVLLVHPGGPFWAKKDEGSWSIPKGEFEENEDSLTAAKREFKEETGLMVTGDVIALESIRQPSGKTVFAWAIKGDFDPSLLKSNTFSIEWPPKSGRQQEFPEIDRAGWFSIEKARLKILKGQVGFLDQLINKIGYIANTPSKDDSNVSKEKTTRQKSLFE